jgi:hypothetical protein
MVYTQIKSVVEYENQKKGCLNPDVPQKFHKNNWIFSSTEKKMHLKL